MTKDQVDLLNKHRLIPVCIVELQVSDEECLRRGECDRKSPSRCVAVCACVVNVSGLFQSRNMLKHKCNGYNTQNLQTLFILLSRNWSDQCSRRPSLPHVQSQFCNN